MMYVWAKTNLMRHKMRISTVASIYCQVIACILAPLMQRKEPPSPSTTVQICTDGLQHAWLELPRPEYVMSTQIRVT